MGEMRPGQKLNAGSCCARGSRERSLLGRMDFHPTPPLLFSLTFKANHPEMGKVTTISKKTKEVTIPWQIQDSQPWEDSTGR